MFHILGRIYVPGTVSLDHRCCLYAVHTENTKSENIQPNGIEYKISMRKENLVLSFFIIYIRTIMYPMNSKLGTHVHVNMTYLILSIYRIYAYM